MYFKVKGPYQDYTFIKINSNRTYNPFCEMHFLRCERQPYIV